MNETEMTVVGNLITKVDKRRLMDGTTVVSFRVASNERRFDRARSTWTNGDTLYLSVTAWRELAEHVHSSMMIGDPIIVRGRLFTSSYAKDGKQHSVTEMEATAVGPNLRWSTAVVTRPRRNDVADPPDSAVAGENCTVYEPSCDDPWTSSTESTGTDDDGFDDLDDGTDGQRAKVAAEAAVGG